METSEGDNQEAGWKWMGCNDLRLPGLTFIFLFIYSLLVCIYLVALFIQAVFPILMLVFIKGGNLVTALQCLRYFLFILILIFLEAEGAESLLIFICFGFICI